jgi:AraC-like DNA-binding protein
MKKSIIHIDRFLALRGIQPKTTRSRPSFVQYPMQGLPWQVISLPECSIAQQSLPCIAIYIKMVELISTEPMCIPYTLAAPSCCLLVLFAGALQLCAEDGQPLVQIEADSMRLGYHPAGEYQLQFEAGYHRFMLIRIDDVWPCDLTNRFPAFADLLAAWLDERDSTIHLAPVMLSKAIGELLDKIRYCQIRKIRDAIVLLTIFEQCVDRYHKQLLQQQRKASDYLAAEGQLLAAYLLSNYHDDISLRIGMICKRFGWSKSQLYRIAGLQLKKSVQQYIVDLRIDRTCLLLRKSKLSIVTIALEIGYGDPDYFSRLFKQKMGISPTEYRNAER